MAKVKRVRTAAQRAASRANIKKAQAARRLAYQNRNRGKAPSATNRGKGFKGLKKNTVPYVRVNKRSQTIGAAAGTIIPGTHKRIVFWGGARLENTTKKGAVDKALNAAATAAAPHGTKRGQVRAYLKKNVTMTNPAIRGALGGAEVRLGTSRGAGPTIIVRRGKHKVSQQASSRAIKRYDTHARKLNAKRQPKQRPQRRKAKRNG